VCNTLATFDGGSLSALTAIHMVVVSPVFCIYQQLLCVGKEMPISRIVVAVPNATVVLLD
jgi:hypothetical protein